MITYNGLRRHRDRTGSFGGMEWKVDFRAGMSDWAAEPKAADFDFGLHFLIEWEIDRFSERRFLPLLDHAILWRAIGVGDAQWAVDQVSPFFGSRKVSVLLQTIFEEDHLRRILPLVDRSRTEAISDALAAALPYDAKWPLLQAPRSRAVAFRDLVRATLEGDDRSRSDLHRTAGRIAARLGESALAGLEQDASKGRVTMATLPGSVLAFHPKLPRDWSRFTEGARLLSEALTNGMMHHARITAIFGELQHFWDHAWYIRALPGYLLHLAESTETAVGVQRVFRVDSRDGDQRQSIQLTVR